MGSILRSPCSWKLPSGVTPHPPLGHSIELGVPLKGAILAATFIYVRELKRDLVGIFLEKPAFLWELDRAHGSNEIGRMYITLYWKVA